METLEVGLNEADAAHFIGSLGCPGIGAAGEGGVSDDDLGQEFMCDIVVNGIEVSEEAKAYFVEGAKPSRLAGW